MPEQSEGNNHTSKINLFPVSHTIFFLLKDQKIDPVVEKEHNRIYLQIQKHAFYRAKSFNHL